MPFDAVQVRPEGIDFALEKLGQVWGPDEAEVVVVGVELVGVEVVAELVGGGDATVCVTVFVEPPQAARFIINAGTIKPARFERVITSLPFAALWRAA